jgi:hypothetical protein
VTQLLTRRGFVALFGLAAAGGVAAGVRLLTEDESSPRRTEAGGLFDDVSAVRRLGDAYLRARPGERGRQRLLRLLGSAGPGSSPALRTGNGGALRGLAARRSQLEFATGALVVVEGWFVAPTEGRLAALETS